MNTRKSRLFYRVNGHNVRLLNPDLADRIAKQTGTPFTGWEQVDANALDQETREELTENLSLLAKMVDPDDAMAQNKAMNDAAIKMGRVGAAERAQIAEKNAAIARLDQYEREQGLISSDKNVREITNFIESDLPKPLLGRWTVQTVDLAVGYLSKEGRLEFKKPEAPAPTPVQRKEPLVKLSDGSMQLPLDRPFPKNATVAQAKDYLARLRKQQQPDVTVVPDFKSALR